MRHAKLRILKPAAIAVLLLAIIGALAVDDGRYYESGLVKSISGKFNSFYGHAQQDRLYVQTDKPFYKPGETIWFTAYLRDAQTFKPSDNSDIVHIELITPKGTTEKHIKIIARDGAARGDFDLSGHPGGIYKIKAYTQWQKNEDSILHFEKEITVQSVVMPRLKMKLDFEKKAYGKGDEVVAKLELNTNANKPLANAQVKFTAQLDGNDLRVDSVMTDATGKANLVFKLPVDLNSIDGLVNARIDFEGNTESIQRGIPIVLNKIKLEFFPEGGDLVYGENSQVAFRATNEFGKPADIEGIIVDSKGAFVSRFSSFHFGMGEVALTPKAGEAYRARITKPTGILDEFSLPVALDAGYVLSVVNKTENSVTLDVQSFQPEELSFIAQTRGKIYAGGSFKANKGTNTFSISTNDFPCGISQITLFDSKGIERCERLVFVHKNKQLKITVTTDKPQYKPREHVSMNIKVTDDKGLPMPGNFSLAVIDDNLLSFADDRQGNILSKMLLEPELKQKVEEPNFYFDAKEPKADKALDLLMMTGGWRHYVWKKIMGDDYPTTRYPGEKATLSGTVFAGYGPGKKRLPGAVVKLNQSGKSVTTDAEGKFTLTKFDFMQDNKIEISDSGYRTVERTIPGYQANFDIYLAVDPTEKSKGLMMRVGNNMNDVVVTGEKQEMRLAEQTVSADVIRAPKLNAPNENNQDAAHRQKNAPLALLSKPAALTFNKDLANAPAPAPVAPDLEPDPGTGIGIGNAEQVNVKVGDKKADSYRAFEKRAELQGKQAVFYRAKEFAAPEYNATDAIRNDFASTVYWNGNVTTDRSGKAKVSFTTNDVISSFKATLEGFAVDGSIGHSEYNFSTSQPFAMDTKIPVELVSGDEVQIPVFLKNTTAADIKGKLQVTTSGQLQLASNDQQVALAANSTKVLYIAATATAVTGDDSLEIKFISDKYNDAVTRIVSVVPKGFPASMSFSGQDLRKEFMIHPEGVVPHSMKAVFTAYPNIMSELMSGVASILREPNGCFEQTSSSNYPNILALQYIKAMQVKDEATQTRATALLDKGYKKLTGFETKETGYEWFGASPPHEALTAYGLMEFVDMKNVYPNVDQQMINRTANLLIARRDGTGGFKKNPKALDAFGKADDDVTNAYIVYALSEAGYSNVIKSELQDACKNAKADQDPYVMALCANALFNTGDKTGGDEMVNRLLSARGEAGFWTGKKHSITRSTGASLKVETTALVLMAMFKQVNPDNSAIINALKFLVEARSGTGGFGSTQATILALKALTRYAEFSRKTDEAGTVEIYVNGNLVGTKDYAKGQQGDIIIAGLEKYIGNGKQIIEVRFKGCNQALPYAMSVTYNTAAVPESAKDCAVDITTKLSATEAKVGETVRLSATVKNKTANGQPMTMALIGLPAGFSAQPWQLKEMQEKGEIDFYEINGNNIAFYYRCMAPNAEKQINLDLKAEMPGEYDAPPSVAYLYYTNELKSWVGLNKVSVRASQ